MFETGPPTSPSQPRVQWRQWLAGWMLLLVGAISAGSVWFGGAPAPPPMTTEARLRVKAYAGGSPAPNAHVTVLADDRAPQEGRTDPNGELELLGCPRAIVTVVVDVPGAVRIRRPVDLTRGDAETRVDLVPGNVVRGRVHDESNLPVPGAVVMARIIAEGDPGLQEPWEVQTDSDGSFVIDTLPNARITLEVSDEGQHETAVVDEVDAPSHEPLDVLLRRTAGLTGRVVDGAGKAIGGVQLTLAGSGVWPARTDTSDAHGEFAFEHLPDGVYEVRGELNDKVSAPIEGIAVNPGNAARVELVMQIGVALRGTVRDIATGKALPGADVEVAEEALSASPKRARAANDGSFALVPLRALAQRVTVRANGYVTEQRWLTPDANAVTFEMLRAVTVSGSVQDSEGRLVAQAELEVTGRSETGYAVRMVGPINEPAGHMPDGSTDTNASNLGVTQGALPKVPVIDSAAAVPVPLLGDLGFRSDARGRFRLDGLPPGLLVLAARKLGLGVGRSRQLQVRAGTPLEDVVIVLPRGAVLNGRVIDGHAQSVAHVRVDLSCSGDAMRSTVSDDGGAFRFDAVRGPCIVQARPLGAPVARLEVAAAEVGQREVQLVLESAIERLTGRVLDSRERPVEAASIHLETGRGRSFSATAVSASDGTFEFDALPAPPYRIQVEHSDYTPSEPIAVAATGKTVLITLQAGVNLTGAVVASFDQAPIAGAQLTFKTGDLERSAISARDGSFEFRHVPAGNYMLSVEAARHVPQRIQRALDSAASQPAFERLVLDRAGSVAGDVVDRLGATVWNAEVAAGEPPDWGAAVRTDHAGHFDLGGIGAGHNRVSARYDGDTVASDGLIRVYAGETTRGVVLRLHAVVGETQEPASGTARLRPETSVTAPLRCVLQDGAVHVESVSPESAAARSGLSAGDVIVSVDAEPVRSAAQVRAMLAPTLGGNRDRVVQVSRAGKLLELRYGNGP